jgi:hypothetical protein
MNVIHPLVALQEPLNIGMLHSFKTEKTGQRQRTPSPSAFSQWRALCLVGADYF